MGRYCKCGQSKVLTVEERDAAQLSIVPRAATLWQTSHRSLLLGAFHGGWRVRLPVQQAVYGAAEALRDLAAVAEEEESPAPPPAAILRGALRVAPGCNSAGAVRRLQYVGGSPTASGEALLTFGGQPEDKPDCLSLLPLPSQVAFPSLPR